MMLMGLAAPAISFLNPGLYPISLEPNPEPSIRKLGRVEGLGH